MTKNITIICTITDDAEIFCIDQRPLVLARMADAKVLEQSSLGANYSDVEVNAMRVAIPFTLYRRRLAGHGVEDCAKAIVKGVILRAPTFESDFTTDRVHVCDPAMEELILVSQLGWSEGDKIRYPTIQELLDERMELQEQCAAVAALFPEPVKSDLLESSLYPSAIE